MQPATRVRKVRTPLFPLYSEVCSLLPVLEGVPKSEVLELIKLAKEMREANQRGEKLGLSTEELAFYDALETNDSAVAVMGDKVLGDLARDLADTVRKSAKIDWTMKESIRAEMRVLVKRTLRKYGYPPDKAEKATDTVIQQAELLGKSLND